MTEKKVMIGVITAEVSRKAIFWSYLMAMRKPDNSIMTLINGQSPAKGRNQIIQQAKDQKCTHILFVDDDIILSADTLEKLIAVDKEIVTGLYLMRNFPHQPIIFDMMEENGRCAHYNLTTETGIIPIVAAGMGCCLISMSVFDKLYQPYFRLGELESDQWCDDLGFFKRVREAEVKSYCDLSVAVGHIGMIAITPVYQNGKWHVGYNSDGINMPTMPLPTTR